MRVIARAYADQPLDRLVVGSTRGAAYVAAAEVVEGEGADPDAGVAFPLEFLFSFDAALFDSLTQAWASGDADALKALWRAACPLGDRALEH